MLRLALLLALLLASASAAPLPPNRLVVASDGGLDPAPRVAIRHCSKGQIASTTAFWRPGVAVSMTFEISPSTPPPSERAAGSEASASAQRSSARLMFLRGEFRQAERAAKTSRTEEELGGLATPRSRRLLLLLVVLLLCTPRAPDAAELSTPRLERCWRNSSSARW